MYHIALVSEQMAVRNHQRAVLAESAREQAKAFRDNKYFRAKATEAAHRDHLQRIAKRKERGMPMDDKQDKLPIPSQYPGSTLYNRPIYFYCKHDDNLGAWSLAFFYCIVVKSISNYCEG